MNKKHRQHLGTENNLSDEAAIPFVPAWDLLEAEERVLSPEEAACVAVTLFERGIFAEVQSGNTPGAWAMHARIESISRRL